MADLLALLEKGSRVVSLVGAGGKTSLMYALGQALIKTSPVLCTTTTHILPPAPEYPLVLMPGYTHGLLALREAWRLSPLVVAVRESVAGSEKLAGLPPAWIDQLAHDIPDAVLLIEADGAARRPLKAPAGHEPVVPSCTQCCIAVVGLDAIGKPLNDATVHRSEQAVRLTGQALESPITAQTLASLATHPEGWFKACPSGCVCLVFGNKADAHPEAEALFKETAQLARFKTGTQDWMVGSVKKKEAYPC